MPKVGRATLGGFGAGGSGGGRKKRGRPKRTWRDASGVWWQWNRPRGSWRPRDSHQHPLRHPEYSGWRKTRNPAVRVYGPVQAWKIRKCEGCGRVRYAWAQTELKFAKRLPDGGVRYWSRAVKAYKGSGMAAPGPVVDCICLGASGYPRRKALEYAVRWGMWGMGRQGAKSQ